jgi:hypothetical protein
VADRYPYPVEIRVVLTAEGDNRRTFTTMDVHEAIRFLQEFREAQLPGAPSVDGLELYAYVGEDELGSGEVGLKQGLTPVGLIPLVATKREKLDRDVLLAQMQRQSNSGGKTIRLVRFVPVEEVITLEPER